ncbi:MAG: redox-sensing transcriptional repressor Rex [Candidatus Omnitrophica bacterium]|nr:redox-sensing transcriptional repressor Rex [Candidatus Omnitrophota bacterium]
MKKSVSQKTISRVLRYSRILNDAARDGKLRISSAELAELTGFSDAQVRKDVSSFGKVGRPRIGYIVADLKKVFEGLVLQSTVHVVLFGVGNLGSAILRYPGFDQEKIRIVAAFDRDKSRVGREINGVRVYDIAEAPGLVKRLRAQIGINATPVVASQEVAETMVRAGLQGIINFAPVTLNVPADVFVRNIDFTIEFLSLFCDIQNSGKTAAGSRHRKAA